MKIQLVHPPGSYADMPTLGMACLSAYAKQHGFNHIDIWDANIDFISLLLQPATLERQTQRIAALPTLLEQQVHDWQRIQFTIPLVISQIEDAIDTLRDPQRYYDISAFNRAMSLIKRAFSIYSLDTDPIQYQFSSNGLYLNIVRDALPFSLQPLLNFAQDEKNLFWLRYFLNSQRPLYHSQPTYDVLGISCPNPHQFLPSLVLARWAKSSGYARHIVLGGSFTTSQRAVICNHLGTFDFFDYIITFEGEIAFVKLLEALGQADGTVSNLADVPNLSYRQGDSIIHNQPVKIDNLDTLPTPDFSGYCLSQYLTPEPVLPGYCTRGCFYDICAFCNHHENYFGKFRSRSTESVLRDMQIYRDQFGSTKVFFVDEVMIPRQQVEIAEGIERNKLGTRWYAHSRVEKSHTQERLKIMAKGGLTLLHVGMESANSNVLKLMKKGYTRDTVLTFLRDLQEVPMTLHLNTIEGFPGEQPHEYIETLETVWQHAKAGDYIHLYPFGFLSHSPLDRDGNPFILNKSADNRNDLEIHLNYELSNIRPPTTQEQDRRNVLRQRLNQFISTFNRIYPEDFCWAAHLLYVSRYRDTHQDHILDQPLQTTPLQSQHLHPFVEPTFAQCTVHTPNDIIVSPDRTEPRLSLLLSEFRLLNVHSSIAQLLADNTFSGKTIAELSVATGLSIEQLKVDLYTLARLGALTVQPKSKKRPRARA